eukprot:jgi/Tetstr1/436681/TSEL_025476.t1
MVALSRSRPSAVAYSARLRSRFRAPIAPYLAICSLQPRDKPDRFEHFPGIAPELLAALDGFLSPEEKAVAVARAAAAAAGAAGDGGGGGGGAWRAMVFVGATLHTDMVHAALRQALGPGPVEGRRCTGASVYLFARGSPRRSTPRRASRKAAGMRFVTVLPEIESDRAIDLDAGTGAPASRPLRGGETTADPAAAAASENSMTPNAHASDLTDISRYRKP